MRYWLLAFLALFAPAASAQTKAKNVLLIIADDLGMDLGCYGNSAIKTPNLDALAKKGVRFTNGYSTCASCSPSRAAIYSGLFTHQNGQYGLQHSAHKQEMHPWVQPISVLMRRAGYFTGIVGKWHVGPPASFDWHKEVKVSRDADKIADAAKNFIASREKKPFFLVVGFQDPHRAGKGFGNEPFANDPKEVKYDPGKVKVPIHLPDQPEVRKEIAEYYQAVSRLDRCVGLILKHLEEAGLLEETLIIFTSDNGIPFPGAKTTLYDAGVHLPLLISAPGHRSGTTNDAMVSFVDLTPTILDWAGAKGPTTYKLPGKSIVPILAETNPKGWDAVFGSHQMHEITMYYPMRSITTPKYKLIVNLDHAKEFPFASDLWGSQSWQGILKRKDSSMGQRLVAEYRQRPKEELFDRATDPHELKNLAGDPAYKEVLDGLRVRLRQWQDDTADPWRILYRGEDAKFNSK